MKACIIRKHLLTPDHKEAMFNLFKKHFSNSCCTNFNNDLSEKDWVILLIEEDARIFGFSTIQIIKERLDDREVIAVFSGDTIVEPDYWKYNMLAPAFGYFIYYCIDKYKDRPIYWYLISKGYRTYKFLPVYFKKYYPTYKRETPVEFKTLIDHFSYLKFKEHYNSNTGIISFNGKKECLCTELLEVMECKKNDPHIAFFLKKNPGHIIGDELACIARLARENMTALVSRIMEQRSVEWIV